MPRSSCAASKRGSRRLVPSTQPALDALVHAFAESEGVPISRIIHALRVAVTGKPVGFGLFDGLAILGRDRCLARIGRALARV